MENASKALLIAAGVLVGLILLSMIMVGYRQISSYYRAKETNKVVQQLSDFNEQYIPYNRDDVRGTDLISLVNRIIDFNKLKDEEEITISITIPGSMYSANLDPNVKLFYYNYNSYDYGINSIRLVDIGNYNAAKITSMLNEANEIESKYSQYGQGMAMKLASNISTVMGENTSKSKKDLLIELKIMKKNESNSIANTRVDNSDILKYYQYVQFKRAHFDCEKLSYTEQGRVKSFKFKFNGTFE